ncbi:hypothetical protein QYM36_001033, partial [Artemia franciscana]
MVFLVEGVLPDGYFGENLRGLSIDMAVFRELLRLRLPELSAHLDMLQQDGADTQGPISVCSIVLDGGSLLHRVLWKVGSTFKAIFASYVHYVQARYTSDFVVVGGYDGGPAIKDATHLRQARMVLSNHLEATSLQVFHSERDADVLIAEKAVETARVTYTIVVVDDTDILVLLISRLDSCSRRLYFSPEAKFGVTSSAWDIREVKQKLGTDVNHLMLFCHSVLGCDTTSHLYGTGKGRAVQLLLINKSFKDSAAIFGTTYEPPLTNVFTMQWFLTLFSTCLPKDSVLRIWDLIFLEGNEVLLRTALALWDSLVDRILAVQSADEFYCIMGVLAREMAEFSSSDTNDLLKTIVEVAPFPFPGLHELREKYTYSLTPWSQSVVSVAKKGLRLIYSDDDDSDSEIKEMTVATAFGLGNMKSPRSRRNSCARSQSSSPASSEDRRNLDVISLTKQYKKLRERQKQAQILWNDTTRKIKDGAQKIAPTSVNQLIITEVNPRSKIAEIETKPDGPLIMRTHFSSV